MGIGDCIDAKCLEPARLFYFPRCPEERLDMFQHGTGDGEPLPVDALLEEFHRIERAAKSTPIRAGQSGSVIAAFNAAYDVSLILEQHGYVRKGRKRWLWPKSTSGLPGVRILPDSLPERIYSSHQGDPLADGHAHDAFDCWRILQHDGEMTRAVREAARLLRREHCEHSSHLISTREMLSVDDQAAENNFSQRKTSKQRSQRSQRSHLEDSQDTESPPQALPGPTAEDLAQAVQTIESAIRECGAKPGILASESFREACRTTREQNHEEWFRLRVALKKAKPSGILLSDIDDATRPENEGSADASTLADELVAMVTAQAELFHDPAGEAFATVDDNGIGKTFKLDTVAFEQWLSYAFYQSTKDSGGLGRAASDVSIRTAKTTLAGIARHEGPEHPVYLRAAPCPGGYIIDMGGDDWRVIEVLPTGWRVLDKSAIRFWRPKPMRALPHPETGGDVARLWEFANIPDNLRPLVLAWLLDAWRPETPFPVLELCGVQGTIKSSTQDKLRRLIDPNAVNLRAAPKSVEDIFVGAGCNWLVSFNNLSHLSAPQQDAFCNLAHGGGFAARTLYTNADETLIECKRAVVINGIVPLVTAQDLADRVIHAELRPIDYLDENEIEAAFIAAWPAILGGLLNLFVKTLAYLPLVKPQRLPRMGDFAKLGEAMMQAEGHAAGAFIELYAANRRESVERGLEASSVASAIREMADTHQGSGAVFEGTMKRLLDVLADYRGTADAWPKSPKGLSGELRRQQPALSAIGINVAIGKAGREGVPVTIRQRTP